MTQEAVSKSVEALEKERDEWRQLAIDNSILADQAVAALGTVAANVGTPPMKAKTHADPAPAPPPAPPPPPRPASTTAFYALPAAERAAVRAAFPNIEDELGEEFHAANRTANARHSTVPGFNVLPAGGSGRLAESAYRASDFDPPSVTAAKWRDKTNDDFRKGQEALAALPDGHPLKAQQASLMAGIGSGRAAPARPVAPAPAPAPVPKGSAPAGAKTRHLPR